ncbi:DUF6515 family protein [Lutibacter sp.]|uniref:DUF6515 family protein n=1 Tax=Lutibacter sp. TaxID=1925666 RepID=UPI0038CD22DE
MRLFYFTLLFLFSISFSSCVTTVRTTPSKIVVIKKLPKTHKVVYIKGHRYYKWNGKHYRKTKKGYVIVRF